MELRLWRSFSANNSGSHYLVGRFDTAEAATRAGDDLRRFLVELAAELDTMTPDERYSRRRSTEAGARFGSERNLLWDDRLVHGEGEDEELDVVTVGDQVLIHHDYCLGFGEGVRDYIAASGGAVEFESVTMLGRPMVSVLAALPDEATATALAELLERAGEPAIGFFDGHVAGHVATLEVDRIEELRAWLAERGATEVEMSLERHHHAHRFAAMASARCPACESTALRYLPALAFDATDDQVACQSCGGMSDASGFFTGPVAHLVLSGPDAGELPPLCYDPLVRRRVVVGRARDNDLPIMNPKLSRRHVAVEMSEGDFVLCELASENGVALNGVALAVGERVPLIDGDVIELPDELRVRVDILDRS